MTQTAPLPPPPPLPPRSHPLATWAMVCAIAGLFCCGFFTAIPAILLAGMAKKKIRESGGAYGGENMAVISGVLGWVGLILSIFFTILTILSLWYMFRNGIDVESIQRNMMPH